MKQAATVHPRGGWQQEENDLLFGAVKEAAAEGKPLRDVFTKVGQQLGRKPNSIRNYYYARVKEEPALAPSKATFRAFDQEELHALLRDVLMAKGRGESVRACVIRRANGDRSAMLRYQNKYRSVLKNKPDLLNEVAQELRQEGLPCPKDVTLCRRYGSSEAGGHPLHLPEGWEKEPGVSSVLEGLGMLLRRMEAQTAALMERAEAAEEKRSDEQVLVMQEDQPSENREADVSAVSETQMMPPVAQIPYEKWLKTRQEADRLRVEVDLLKIALEEAEQGKVQPSME